MARWILSALILLLPCLASAQATRTFGGDATDTVAVASYTAVSANTNYSMVIWSRRTGDGGGGFGRLYDADVSSVAGWLWYNWAPTTSYRFVARAVGGDGTWDLTRPSTNVWSHVALVYAFGTTTNDPAMYLDGVEGFSDVSTPDNNTAAGSAAVSIGNIADIRGWAGQLGFAAIWDDLLTADEVQELSTGIWPSFVSPDTMVMFVPNLGADSPELNLTAAAGANDGTVTVTATSGLGPPVWFPGGGQ